MCIEEVGICGSDLGYWLNGYVGSRTVTVPTIMGHEPSGTVSKLGEGVKHLKIGKGAFI